MKRSIYLLGGVLCLFLVFLYISVQNGFDGERNVSQRTQAEKIVTNDVSDQVLSDESPSKEETELRDDEKPAYVKAYMDFLLADIDEGHDFPIRGYYLFDFNFDDIPELGVLHDSWGSMGGYFTCYYFDGNGIAAVLNDRGEPARVSDDTQILADFEQKKVYLLKEMYLLQGNENGTYGYIKEIKNKNQYPCVYDILDLQVDQGSDLSSRIATQYDCEDGFLSDSDLENCLVTQIYMEKEWIDISSDEYLKRKRELIPEENSFVDLREGDLNYFGANYDDNGDLLYTDVRMGKDEIEQLFERYAQSLENK